MLNSSQWRNMKNKKGIILLACSFGPDSMALFNMLLNLYGPESFEVAHVNYNLREESVDETKNLVEYCKKFGIKIHVLDVEKNSIKGNVEAECRKIRYNFFSSVFKSEKGKFEALYVAHNQDDLIETYLIQKQRQNLVEYYGIKRESQAFGMKIVRPLLTYKKSDLLNYCKENKVPFAIDKTNLEDKYLRNRIRHQVVENLSDEDRKQILDEIENKNRELRNLKTRLRKLDLYKVDQITTLKNAEFAIAINMLVKKISKPDYVSKKYALEIKKALLSPKPNLQFCINLHLTLIKTYNDIKITKKKVAKKYSYKIDKPCVLDTEQFHLDFTKDSSNRNVTLDDYPLKIRNAKANDQILIKNYLKPARRLFIDWKMPKELRASWPVIENKDGKIIYMPRYQKDFVVTEDVNFYVK